MASGDKGSLPPLLQDWRDLEKRRGTDVVKTDLPSQVRDCSVPGLCVWTLAFADMEALPVCVWVWVLSTWYCCRCA